jgi:hypothetical protein
MKRKAARGFQTDLFTFIIVEGAFGASLQGLFIVGSEHAFVMNRLRQFVDAHNAGQKGSRVCMITHEDLAKRNGDLGSEVESRMHTETEREKRGFVKRKKLK